MGAFFEVVAGVLVILAHAYLASLVRTGFDEVRELRLGHWEEGRRVAGRVPPEGGRRRPGRDLPAPEEPYRRAA